MDDVDNEIDQDEPEEIQGFNPEGDQIECKIREQQDIQREEDNDDIYDISFIFNTLLTMKKILKLY